MTFRFEDRGLTLRLFRTESDALANPDAATAVRYACGWLAQDGTGQMHDGEGNLPKSWSPDPANLHPLPNAWVIVHPEMGIYLGSFMGMGFWSKLDPVGQPAAVAFPSEEAAEGFMATWDDGRPAGATLHQVRPDEMDGTTRYASITACIAAGLEGWSA